MNKGRKHGSTNNKVGQGFLPNGTRQYSVWSSLRGVSKRHAREQEIRQTAAEIWDHAAKKSKGKR